MNTVVFCVANVLSSHVIPSLIKFFPQNEFFQGKNLNDDEIKEIKEYAVRSLLVNAANCFCIFYCAVIILISTFYGILLLVTTLILRQALAQPIPSDEKVEQYFGKCNPGKPYPGLMWCGFFYTPIVSMEDLCRKTVAADSLA